MTSVALHLWQSTLVLVAAWMLAQACRRNTATTRYWIWFAASVKFLIPLAFLQWLGDCIGRTFAEPTQIDPALVDVSLAILAPSVQGLIDVPDDVGARLQIVLAAIWALGALAMTVRWFLQWQAIQAARARVDGAPA